MTAATSIPETVSFNLDESTFTATINKQPIELSPEEFMILKLIEEANGSIVHVHEISNYMKGPKRNDSMFINSLVKSLKQKLGKTGRMIEAILGVGYRLKSPHS